MKYNAYAKINIRLKVLGKNEFGYHNLSMVNAKISLADEIEFKENSQNIVSYSIEELNFLENNLCLNVLNEMCETFKINKKYHIYIKKNIPLGAGLGGGSSDVACIINAINELHKLNLTLEEKINIGLKYGADVPYCLINDLSLVTGIGETIQPLNIKFSHRLAIVYPNIFVSTKDVFKNVKRYSEIDSIEFIKKCLESKDYLKLLINDLEKPSFELQPQLALIKDELSKIGSVVMSGSGSSMIVFIDEDKDFEEIKKMWPTYLVVDAYII